MKKFLVKSGNSWVFTFTRTILDMLEVDPSKDQVEVEFEGKSLKITKAKEEQDQ